MKEIIKYETDENGDEAVFTIHATRYTTMMLIARLLLNMATGSKGKQSVEELLTDLKVVYIPILTKWASKKATREEVAKTE